MSQLDIQPLDRKIKWWLLVVSLLTLVVLAAAALRENVFTQWRFIRYRYAQILKEMAVDEQGKRIAEQFEIRVFQNVLPGLETVDRCVTCHPGATDPRMVDQEQPFRTHPGDYLKSHPTEKFGCTVCHRGQGRALNFDEAKAEGYFWDFPFLPREYLTAECGRCHTRLPYGPPETVRLGEMLFRNRRCVDCHRLDKLGPDDGHDLTSRGLRLVGRDWWSGHPPYGPMPGGERPALAQLAEDERQVLQQFLLSKNGAPQLAWGQYLYEWYGCGGCHKVNSSGGTLGPELTDEGRKIKGQFSFAGVRGKHDVANWIYEHFLDPRRVTPESKMPRFGMSRSEARALTTYMLSLRAEPDLPQSYIPADARVSEADTGEQGRKLFLRYCSGCHGRNGEGQAMTSFGRSVPGILNPDFLKIAPASYIRQVAREGRPERDMPAWAGALREAELESILSYVETVRPRPLSFDGVPASGSRVRGKTVFEEKCAVCHGENGEGTIGPRLNTSTFLAIAGDRFLFETIMRGRPYTAMPAWAGDLTVRELSDLLALFRSWRGTAAGPRVNLPDALPPPGNGEGASLYQRHCARCHGDQGQGGPAVALHNPVLLETASTDFLAASLDRCRESAAQEQTSGGRLQGPDRLSAWELGEVVSLLQSWRYMPLPVPPALYRPLRSGNSQRGAGHFRSKCAPCHGDSGVGGVAPAIGSRRFLESVSDGFLAATIALGRGNTIMLPRGLNAPGNAVPLTAGEILDVVAYLRSLQGTETAGVGDFELQRREERKAQIFAPLRLGNSNTQPLQEKSQ